MVYIGLNAKKSECPDTSNSKKHLLFKSVLQISAIEMVSNCAVLRQVVLKICIHEVERSPSHICPPEPCMKGSSGKCNLNNYPVSVLISHLANRKFGEVLSLILCHLVALSRKFLSKITISVQKTNSCYWNHFIA